MPRGGWRPGVPKMTDCWGLQYHDHPVLWARQGTHDRCHLVELYLLQLGLVRNEYKSSRGCRRRSMLETVLHRQDNLCTYP